MRKLKFTSEELPIIKEFVVLGNSEYENDFPEVSKLILNKLRIEIYHFTNKETQVLKSYCSNWINNNQEIINSLTEKYLYNKITNFKNITENELIMMKKIDIVYTIKSKLFLKKYLMFESVIKL